MRNILLFILLLIVVWWARRSLQEFQARRAASRRKPKADEKALPEQVRPCAHCGLHVPESEGVDSAGRFYCCDAHRRLGEPR